MTTQSERRVLLVTTPWLTPNLSSVALATLRPILEAAGIPTDTLYASVLYPRTDSECAILERHGQLLFVPYLYPDADVDQVVEGVVRRYVEDIEKNICEADADSLRRIGVNLPGIRLMVRREIGRAGVCLERSFARATRRRYDVVGFSLTFECQLPAALALARRLKQHDPTVKIVFGGAACVAEQAEGLVASFPIIDAVCSSEGETVIVDIVRALRGELPLEQIGGLAFRDSAGRVVRTPSPPLIEDLDLVPFPCYDDFIEQISASEWADLPLKLFFETSRGCWWGEKHLCTFCGLNGDGLSFRAKSPERAFQEIRSLYWDYPRAQLLQATDNILHTQYFDTLLPKLARMERDPARPLRMFFEIKSNIKPQHAALMAAAGIDAVQPGIESFSDQVLELMDKGCTALGQVQCIKWCYQEGVDLVYNILFGSPGETAAEYEQMLDLLPYVTHLPPPVGVTRLELMRFSPYYLQPAKYGITNVRPQSYYRDLFLQQDVDLMRLTYHFDYDHPMQADRDLLAVHQKFSLAVFEWQQQWRKGLAFYLDRGDHLAIVDRRTGTETVRILGGVAARLFRYLDTARSVEAVARELPDIEPAIVEGLLDQWHHQRWVYRSPAGRVVAVLPRVYERARDLSPLLEEADRRAQAAAARHPDSRPALLRVVA